jgi:glutamate 5-kinase
VVVVAGAARALRDGGTSLLPVGIVSVEGAFEAGDAVEVRAAAADLVGKGISNYSAAELRRVMGMKSTEVREVLPRATDEAVHRDYFVLA